MNQQRPEAVKAARELRVELVFETVRNRDYADAFARVAASRPDSLFLTANTYFVLDRKPIIELAAKYRLPAIYEWPEQVEEGGLMSYGPASLAATYRRIAEKIDKVLEGANPGDLPVEQSSKLELVIQSQDCEGNRIVDPAIAATAGGQGDRVAHGNVCLREQAMAAVGRTATVDDQAAQVQTGWSLNGQKQKMGFHAQSGHSRQLAG